MTGIAMSYIKSVSGFRLRSFADDKLRWCNTRKTGFENHENS